MGKKSIDELARYLESNADVVDIGIPASEGRIAEAEVFLDIKLPEDYRSFLLHFGTLAIGPNEYYGIAGNSFERSSVPNGVWFTAKKRADCGLPSDLIVLADHEGDELVCLQPVSEHTSQLVVWDVAAGSVSSLLSSNLFGWILEDSEDFLVDPASNGK